MKAAITVFPGSNCDRDVRHVLADVLGFDVEYVWHEDRIPSHTELVVLPGGFSYGDRLRAGAIASHSPVIGDICELASSRTPIIGICNGFQILAEAGILPGTLLRNDSLSFMCGWTEIAVENAQTPFTSLFGVGDRIPIPIANGEGRYYADEQTLSELRARGQIVFRYTDDVNGSAMGIAGVCSRERNVVGMMPHPERASEPDVGPGAGAASKIFRSVLEHAGVPAR